MKTITLTLAIAIMTAFSLQANNNTFVDNNEVKLQEESYVNDVPFNTAEIAMITDGDQSKEQDVTLEEEAYVNDVNIDTRQVVLNQFNTFWSKAKSFARALGENINSLSDNDYFNNNTLNLSKLYQDLTQTDEFDVQLEEEPYVDDVPFNTEDIVD